MYRKAGAACELSLRHVWGHFVTSVVQAWVCKTHMQNSGLRPNCSCLKFSLCLIRGTAKPPAVSVSEALFPLMPHTLTWLLLVQPLDALGAMYQGETCLGGENRDSVCSLILNVVFSWSWFKSFCSKNLTSVMHSQPHEVTQDLQLSVGWRFSLE